MHIRLLLALSFPPLAVTARLPCDVRSRSFLFPSSFAAPYRSLPPPPQNNTSYAIFAKNNYIFDSICSRIYANEFAAELVVATTTYSPAYAINKLISVRSIAELEITRMILFFA